MSHATNHARERSCSILTRCNRVGKFQYSDQPTVGRQGSWNMSINCPRISASMEATCPSRLPLSTINLWTKTSCDLRNSNAVKLQLDPPHSWSWKNQPAPSGCLRVRASERSSILYHADWYHKKHRRLHHTRTKVATVSSLIADNIITPCQNPKLKIPVTTEILRNREYQNLPSYQLVPYRSMCLRGCRWNQMSKKHRICRICLASSCRHMSHQDNVSLYWVPQQVLISWNSIETFLRLVLNTTESNLGAFHVVLQADAQDLWRAFLFVLWKLVEKLDSALFFSGFLSGIRQLYCLATHQMHICHGVFVATLWRFTFLPPPILLIHITRCVINAHRLGAMCWIIACWSCTIIIHHIIWCRAVERHVIDVLLGISICRRTSSRHVVEPYRRVWCGWIWGTFEINAIREDCIIWRCWWWTDISIEFHACESGRHGVTILLLFQL